MPSQIWLINTRSGGYRSSRLLDALPKEVETLPLDFTKLPEQLDYASRFDRLVIAGGDGTFASVLTSPSLPPQPAALIPLGTANDLARELGMHRVLKSRSWNELPKRISTLQETPLAIWEICIDGQKRLFCNYCSLGFEGAVVADFAEWRAKQTSQGVIKNRIAYTLIGARRLGTRLRAISLRSEKQDSVTIDATRGIIVTNIRSHMGIGLASGISDSADDSIECVNASSPFDYLRMVASPLGLLSPPRCVLRGSEIIIEGLPLDTNIQLDGEPQAPVNGGAVKITFKKSVAVLRA